MKRLLGWSMIGAGVMILGWFSWENTGTNVVAGAHQQQEVSAYRAERQPRPRELHPKDDEVFGIVEIPKIGLTAPLVQGVGTQSLKDGVGHYPGSPWPGQLGNVALAGHRTTYGASFWNLQALRPGDLIVVTTSLGTARYIVTTSLVVSPDNLSVLDPPSPGIRELTLTTCHPRFTALQRLVVHAAEG